MLIFFLFVVSLLNVKGLSLNPAVRSKVRAKRLIGGRDSTIEEHPYQVAIELADVTYKCSGAIISRHYVLTAAHCINTTVDAIKIRSGSSEREEGGALHDVVDILVHENYYLNERRNSNYDIGVVRVKPPFRYGPTRKRVALYDEVKSDDFTTDSKLAISGWGYMDHDENVADQLQTLEVPWISKQSCNDYYLPFGGIYKGQICTGYIGERDKDVCSGDSGAPLIYQGKVIGVAAYTEGQCGLLDYPTVYTEVAYFLDWIEDHVEFDSAFYNIHRLQNSLL